jgi:hypothetical protein
VPPADAVTVRVLAPTTRGTPATLQADAEPAAVPEVPPLADQMTLMAPDPPVAEPDKLTLEAVVVEATAFTVSVKGEPGGAAVVEDV